MFLYVVPHIFIDSVKKKHLDTSARRDIGAGLFFNVFFSIFESDRIFSRKNGEGDLILAYVSD